MQRRSVHDLAAALRPRSQRSSKSARGRILDQFCAATGYHRVYARALLRSTPAGSPAPTPSHGRPARYGLAETRLLQACWDHGWALRKNVSPRSCPSC